MTDPILLHLSYDTRGRRAPSGNKRRGRHTYAELPNVGGDYPSEDWCKDGPNCITRTLQIVKDGLQAVIDGKGSDADKATAKCIKDRLDAMKGYYPGDFKNDLKKLAEDY